MLIYQTQPYKVWVGLHIAGADEVRQTGTHIVAFFDVGHVRHIVEEEYFGMVCHHCLCQGYFDRNAGVVFAIDEEGGDFKLLKDVQTRRTGRHAALGGDDAFRLGFKALVLDVLNLLVHYLALGRVKERGDEADDVACTVLADLLAGSHAPLDNGIAVGHGV